MRLYFDTFLIVVETQFIASYNIQIIAYKGLMDKINAKKLYKPLFYLPLQAFENMNKKYAFTVAVK